jgi:hypothetical protein
LLVWLAALVVATPVIAAPTPPDPLVGEAIFRHGTLSSGAALKATVSGVHLEGAAAACQSCHRRSGLGSREGRSLIPPITGRYLYRSLSPTGDELDVLFVEGMRERRAPYSDATLARAIREGIDSEGHLLKAPMPRFELGDTDMAALIDYLKNLDQRHVPGVTDTTLHFATIITPDADPAKRRGMLAVLEQYFAERNARQMTPAPRIRSKHLVSFMAHRFWELHVWELQGPAETWGVQLDRHMKTEPVFAVVSGLAGHDWTPVHEFCERAQVPCLFPNVEVPPSEAASDYYSLYFSKSVLLEAELIADRILEGDTGAASGSVHQIYRKGDSGEAAAEALSTALERHGIVVHDHALAPAGSGEEVAAAVHAATGASALVTWLRANDVAALGNAPPPGTELYMSGLLGGLEHAPLPPAFRERTHLSYPFDLPDQRRVRMDFAFGWFRIRKVPVVAEQVQADTYLACGLLSETMNHLSDSFVREYLIERIEDMIEHRILTGYYPRLTLATGQRFASKGGYLVHFAAPSGTKLVADGAWTVPSVEPPPRDTRLGALPRP